MFKANYDSSYEDDIDFSGFTSDIKPIAFHLPQFHEIPENNEWWGNGFTEWTNTRKAVPRFDGHYMPRNPHPSIGYYDLSDWHVLKKQAELARKHGLYGFCFYAYWFSGKRLLEKPLDLLLEHPEIDINFCLCWANESWTRAWDGQEKHVLIKQNYFDSDPENFIKDMKKYFDDKRYIRVDGKPFISVYAPCSIPDASNVFKKWRETARKIGIGEIYISLCRTFQNTAKTLGLLSDVDSEMEFPPHYVSPNVYKDTIPGTGNNSYLMSYKTLVDELDYDYSSKPVYRSVMMAWDNSARRDEGWCSYCDFSLEYFRKWIHLAAGNIRRNIPFDRRFMFVNAWNEWAEGTCLEPDEKYGFANINTLSRAIFCLGEKDVF